MDHVHVPQPHNLKADHSQIHSLKSATPTVATTAVNATASTAASNVGTSSSDATTICRNADGRAERHGPDKPGTICRYEGRRPNG
jgi:hypothetical protein